jgi:hypothetical protein
VSIENYYCLSFVEFTLCHSLLGKPPIRYKSAPEGILEQLWVILYFRKQKIGFGVVYRPPNANVESSLDELCDVMKTVCLETTSVILSGDVNINFLNTRSRELREFVNVMNSFYLHQVISEPTRITENSESLIDVICLNECLNECIITLFDLHAPLQQFNLKKNCTITFQVEIFHMKSFWASS